MKVNFSSCVDRHCASRNLKSNGVTRKHAKRILTLTLRHLNGVLGLLLVRFMNSVLDHHCRISVAKASCSGAGTIGSGAL